MHMLLSNSIGPRVQLGDGPLSLSKGLWSYPVSVFTTAPRPLCDLRDQIVAYKLKLTF